MYSKTRRLKRTSMALTVAVFGTVVGVIGTSSACTPLAKCVTDAVANAGNTVKGVVNDPPGVKTPAGTVCPGCLVTSLSGTLSIIRLPGNGVNTSKFTYLNSKGKTWSSSTSSSGGAAAAASGGGCADASCYNSEYRADLPLGAENSYIRLYGVITLMMPTFDTGTAYFALLYMKSSGTTKQSNVEARSVVNGVAETHAPSSFVTDWSPNGSHDWGSPKSQSFTIGGSYKGTGFTISRGWTSVAGRIEGQAPGGGGKNFVGSWQGKLKNGTAPWIGGATYRVAAGEPSTYEYQLYMTYSR